MCRRHNLFVAHVEKQRGLCHGVATCLIIIYFNFNTFVKMLNILINKSYFMIPGITLVGNSLLPAATES